MRVVFSDESGCGDESEPLTVITAILLDLDNQWEPVQRDLTAIRAFMPPQLLNKKHASEEFPGEIKGSLLFKGLRGKIDRIKTSTAADFLSQILLLVPAHGIYLFHGAIDRDGRTSFVKNTGVPNVSEQEEAFRECLRHLEDFARGSFPKEKILWIADHSGSERHVKAGLKFHRWLQVLDLSGPIRRKHREGEEGDLPSIGRNIRITDDPRLASPIVDTIYFGDSHESLLLQLADVCCSTITQHLMGQDDARDSYGLIRRQLQTDGKPIVFSRAWGGKSVE